MIEKANAQEIPYIIGLYKDGLKEIGAKNILDSLVCNKVVSAFKLAPCFLLKIDGIIRGIAGLTICHSSHSGDAMLSDYMFYIQPEYRSLKNLSDLVRACQSFAKEHDLPLRVDFIVNDDEKIKQRLLRMHDFKTFSIVGIYNDGE